MGAGVDHLQVSVLAMREMIDRQEWRIQAQDDELGYLLVLVLVQTLAILFLLFRGF